MQRPIFTTLLRMLAAGPFALSMDAPKSVEMTLYDQPEQRRFVAHFLNFQDELPNVPVHDIKVKLRMGGRMPVRVVQLPEGEAIAFSTGDDCVQFSAPRLDTYLMIGVEYRNALHPAISVGAAASSAGRPITSTSCATEWAFGHDHRLRWARPCDCMHVSVSVSVQAAVNRVLAAARGRRSIRRRANRNRQGENHDCNAALKSQRQSSLSDH